MMPKGLFKLTGKGALVTGATGGLGSQIARDLARQGAKLVLSATNEERLQKLASELGELGAEVKTVKCDLAHDKEVEALFDEAEKQIGQVDILVCNAGIVKDGLAMRMKTEDFDLVLRINLRSTFILNRSAVSRMIKRRFGRIINISSIVGVNGNPGQGNYAASKARIIGMSKSIAAEVSTRGITINCIAPGYIESAMTDAMTEQQKQVWIAKIPMGRMGIPSEISAAVAFLASSEASYITGHTININGGMLMM